MGPYFDLGPRKDIICNMQSCILSRLYSTFDSFEMSVPHLMWALTRFLILWVGFEVWALFCIWYAMGTYGSQIRAPY